MILNIVSLCLLALVITSTEGIKCNLCVGNPESDCARSVESSMVILTCPDHIPTKPAPHPYRHPRPHYRPHYFADHMATWRHHQNLNEVDNSVDENKPMHPSGMGNFDLYHNEMEHKIPVYTPPTPPPSMMMDAYCVQLRGSLTNSSLVMKGCGYAPEGKDACKYIMRNNKGITSCIACRTDKCNL